MAEESEASSPAKSPTSEKKGSQLPPKTESSLYNFTLPTTFPSRVEVLLEKGEYLVGTACNQFIQTIAHAMLAVKRYPSPGEYDAVAEKIIFSYPFLASQLGAKTVSH